MITIRRIQKFNKQMEETKMEINNTHQKQQQQGQTLSLNPNMLANLEQIFPSQNSNGFEAPSKINLRTKAFFISILCASIVLLYNFMSFSTTIQSYKIEQLDQTSFQIVNSGGKIITMNYSKPQLFHPSQLPQQPLTQLQYFLIGQIKQFIRILGTEFEIAYQLHNNWFLNKNTMFQVEYFILDQKIGLSSKIPQKHIFLLAPMKKLSDNIEIFMQSINQQNYSNYRVFLLQDKQFKQNEMNTFIQSTKKYPRFNNRLWIARSPQKIGILGLQDYVIKTFASPGDIIMEISLDSSFIGKQVLNTFNRMYHTNNNTWFYYTDYVKFEGNHDQRSEISNTVSPGVDKNQNQFVRRDSTYRISDIWLMGGLRTYLRDLYVKIPATHLFQRGTCKYYQEVSETFVSFALAQLAGQNHTFFYPAYPYLKTDQPQINENDDKECLTYLRSKQELQSKIQTPFRSLISLSEKSKIVKNYTIPQKIMREYVQKQWQYKICISKQGKKGKIFQSL